MDKFTRIIQGTAKFLLNPLQIISRMGISDKFIDLMSKNVWIKILLSFIIMLVAIFAVYVFKLTEQNISVGG